MHAGTGGGAEVLSGYDEFPSQKLATAVSTDVADVAAFDTDVDQIIVDKAKQLTERIRDFRAGLYDFGGVTGRDVDSIYSVTLD